MPDAVASKKETDSREGSNYDSDSDTEILYSDDDADDADGIIDLTLEDVDERQGQNQKKQGNIIERNNPAIYIYRYRDESEEEEEDEIEESV